MGPNKLESYITLGQESLPGTITLAYWPVFELQRKLRFVNMTREALGTIN